MERILLRILLWPVWLILVIAGLMIRLAVRITSAPLGFIIMYITGFGLYCLFTKRWSDMFILALIGAGVIVLMFIFVFLQETCNTLIERIRTL